ncbi:MAG: RES family NAD+ phosphorylase [Acidimicrobiales bacterium]
MAKLPWPPAPDALARRAPAQTVTLDPDMALFRIYAARGTHPGVWDRLRRFGPVATARFDHHDPPPHDQDRSIAYLAARVRTTVAEFFQRTRLVDRVADDPWLVGLRLTRAVVVLDVRGGWPTRAGASQAISSGPRDRARAWSRAAYAAFPEVEGLVYRSRVDGGAPAVALYEPAADAWPDRPEVHVPLSHPGLVVPLAQVAITLGYRFR